MTKTNRTIYLEKPKQGNIDSLSLPVKRQMLTQLLIKARIYDINLPKVDVSELQNIQEAVIKHERKMFESRTQTVAQTLEKAAIVDDKYSAYRKAIMERGYFFATPYFYTDEDMDRLEQEDQEWFQRYTYLIDKDFSFNIPLPEQGDIMLNELEDQIEEYETLLARADELGIDYDLKYYQPVWLRDRIFEEEIRANRHELEHIAYERANLL